ncbi:MAG: hypothetical protein K0S32_1294 [Bacteroidetes bacterium]|jgi:hypothetical protein|nr:hypothetical protein [Bacteroidota bacterium]
MRLHLDHTPDKPDFKIDHEKNIFLVGSCFSENIGNYLSDHKFKVLSNPSGILFNPASIHACLENCIDNSSLDEKYILNRNGLYYSFLHHSSVNDKTKEGLITKVKSINQKANEFLKTTDLLIITFGSAFVYEHKGLFEIVSNCHKQPATDFDKKLMKVEEIVTMYEKLFSLIKKVNSGIKIVLTVSPVKYLKDGVIGNNLSKSTLLLAVNDLCKKTGAFYFPAYELINDDLRDYRFYKKDLAHPNEQGIEYVWNKFSYCFFTGQTLVINENIRKLNTALNHRPMNDAGEDAEKFENFVATQKQLIKNMGPNIQL